jgi:hypothetical protein
MIATATHEFREEMKRMQDELAKNVTPKSSIKRRVTPTPATGPPANPTPRASMPGEAPPSSAVPDSISRLGYPVEPEVDGMALHIRAEARFADEGEDRKKLKKKKVVTKKVSVHKYTKKFSEEDGSQ